MTDLLVPTTMSAATDAATALAASVDHIATPLTDARAQLAEAIGFLGYDNGLHQMLATPRASYGRVPLRLDDG